MNKLRNALTNTVVVFMMIVCVSAVLAVFVHSVIYVPAWTSVVVGSLALLFLTMLAVEHSKEENS